MSAALLSSLDACAAWRRGLDCGIEQLCALLGDCGLLDAPGQALSASLRQRLASDRLVLAFVAESSRGKSELINALFFADTGRLVLPATPGRTTMCALELTWDALQPAALAPLASAHAVIFLLAADTGVSRGDLAVWRDHLSGCGVERFVVLNKIDTLADPLLDAAQVEAQVQHQCAQAAQTLGVAPARVFALSARQALAARVQQDGAALSASRLPALEAALMAQLLPQRGQVVGHMVDAGVLALQRAALRRLSERQRQTTGQLSDLRSLRGKSAARLRMTRGRLDAEAADFERCAPKLAALRSVLLRQLQAVLDGLSSDLLREAVHRMHDQGDSSLLKLGAARAFGVLGQQLKESLASAERGVIEIEQMLQASQRTLHAEFGLSLAAGPRPALDRFVRELGRIEQSHRRYVGPSQLWHLLQSGFMARFSHMLLARLRMVFEGAATEIELWARQVSAQIDDQLRERRACVQQRRQAHDRIVSAEGGLEHSHAALVAQVAELQDLGQRVHGAVNRLRILAATPPAADGAQHSPHLQRVAAPVLVPTPGAA